MEGERDKPGVRAGARPAPGVERTGVEDLYRTIDEPLLGQETQSVAPAPRDRPPEQALLLVFEQDSSAACHLPPTGEATIGRAAECAVRLRDQAASRQHARVTLIDGEARLADLDSHNGTRLNGEPVVGSRPLRSGDVITIGQSSLVYHAGVRHRPERAVTSLARLRERFEEELERAVRYGRRLAIVAVRLDGPFDRARVAAVVASRVRVIDVLAWEGPTRLAALLPELDAGEATRCADVLIQGLRRLGAEARGGVAACPDDGCDVDALLAGAAAAADQAAAGAVARVDAATTTLDLGGQSIVVADLSTRRLFDLLRRLAAGELSVLIQGETGSGKEVAALALHVWSPRAAKPLRSLNCAAMQETLIESELFGYEKGAFTGAAGARPGLFEQARGGTLFLDEVGELSPAAQAKLLRVLETRRVTRLGDVREREIDVRVVAATNRGLLDEIRAGRFREDLFFRLDGARVVVPPLRSRPRELAVLAHRFLDEAATRAALYPLSISPRAMQAISSYEWPGNIRELKHAMEYACATIDGEVVEPWHLPAGPRAGAGVGGAEADEVAAALGAPPAPPSTPAPRLPAPAGVAPAGRFRPIAEELHELERRRMLEALEAAGWVQAHAAALIGMPLRTFMHKMKTYELRAAQPSPPRR